MIGFDSLTTFSGMLAFVATLALFWRRFTIGATVLIIAGAAGVGIFWDRWSRETGSHVQIQAVFSGDRPTEEQLALLATHLPMLALGVLILALQQRSIGKGGHK